eukprot:CAMPEP_0201577902 /NCGR_PEP_ID=MMETSP0190_2-20130828/24480_1 /ASSEMBLY_ACC=CAM_ASM_000263 /TAXON_ID=37353 /ORGANISM="Rosalina sp." /LENGTH=102 /DNA_ID=CAMNT_0048010439 /DNA_START=347 /DNA_END=655 /DNA_ORIENTATION=-
MIEEDKINEINKRNKRENNDEESSTNETTTHALGINTSMDEDDGTSMNREITENDNCMDIEMNSERTRMVMEYVSHDQTDSSKTIQIVNGLDDDYRETSTRL